MKRQDFIPDTIWVEDAESGWMVPLRRSDDPQGWERLCEADDAVITQVDDGHLEDGKGIRPSSSSSAPSLMRKMIDALSLEKGMRVLEVGTGTGYNAALLAEIAGPAKVVSIEVDSAVAEHARRALTRADVAVTVVTADGANGCPAHAPFDRVIVTAAVQKVPAAWIEQTKPGGMILVPWASAFAPGGALLPLVVAESGIVAEGRFGEHVVFMRIREQRPGFVSWADDDHAGRYAETATEVDLSGIFGPDVAGRFVMGAMLPDVATGNTVDQTGARVLRLSHSPSDSWASCALKDPGPHVVRQHGPRTLWDELGSSYGWWVRSERPEHTRFGMTVAADRQQIWLDTPDNVIGRPPGRGSPAG